MMTRFFSRYKNYSIQVQVGENKVTCNFTPWGEFGHFSTEDNDLITALCSHPKFISYSEISSWIAPPGKDIVYTDQDPALMILPPSSANGTIAQPFGLTSENLPHFLNNLPVTEEPAFIICYKDGVQKTPADNFAFNNRFVHKVTKLANSSVDAFSISLPEGKWFFYGVLISLVSNETSTETFSIELEGMPLLAEDVQVAFTDPGSSCLVTQVEFSDPRIQIKIIHEGLINSSISFTAFQGSGAGYAPNVNSIFDFYLMFERMPNP